LLGFQHYDISDETGDIAKRKLSVDKELIKLIQIACKKDNIPRAIELTKLLHHIASLDMALKVADFYHLVGLREKIETLKEVREGNSRSVVVQERKRQWTKLPHNPNSDYMTSVDPLVQLSVTSGANLARAMPLMETSRHSSNMAETVSVTSSTAPDSIIGASAKQKRKWVEGSSSEQMTSLESSAPRLSCT
jgi:chromosome transmission fidelity protein 4